LQGLLQVFGIWFTVPFGEAITIGRERWRSGGVIMSKADGPMSGASLIDEAAASWIRRWSPSSEKLRHDRAPTHKAPGRGAVADQDNSLKGIRAVRDLADRRRALSAPAGNEGVGEHVRTKFQPGLGPREIADRRIRTERRKPVSSARPFFRRSKPFF
jgi:hypothetical protein